jgi:glycosyltransferase involved in cell wall biosynthesis
MKESSDISVLTRNPLVSVVTPSYNALPFIIDTIKSVQLQDYPTIEHIVIDGSSVDGTREVLKQHPHLIWISEPDKGQSEAINKGFRMARGEIIGWLNADDTYRPGAVSCAVEYLQAHPDVDLVYTDVQVIDEHDQPVRLARSGPFSFEEILINNMVKQPTIFMRKKVIDSLGGVDEDLHYVMDYEFWLRAGRLFNLQYLPGEIFANFRYCRGTKSYEETDAFHQEWMRVLDDLQEYPDWSEEIRLKVKRAKQLATREYYFALVVQASHNGKKVESISYFLRAISSDWKSIFQTGVWKLFIRSFTKKSIFPTDERSKS